MNEYEIVYLANPKLSEQEKDQLDESVDTLITQHQGEISYSSATDSPASRRRLHYPIEEARVAWVRVLQTQVDPAKVEELRHLINKQNGVLRVSVIQTPRREEVPPELLETLKEQKEEKATTPVKPTTPKKEVTMEEVEEKIEEALDEEVK